MLGSRAEILIVVVPCVQRGKHPGTDIKSPILDSQLFSIFEGTRGWLGCGKAMQCSGSRPGLCFQKDHITHRLLTFLKLSFKFVNGKTHSYCKVVKIEENGKSLHMFCGW